MPNLNQAPTLLARGKKVQGNTSMGYAQIPHNLMSYICATLTKEKKVGQLSLMLFLIGNAQDGTFKPATQTILDRTGISSKSSLSNMKKDLRARGWIDYEEGQHITVLYDNIYSEMQS